VAPILCDLLQCEREMWSYNLSGGLLSGGYLHWYNIPGTKLRSLLLEGEGLADQRSHITGQPLTVK